ncbi:hypothetical protein GGS23DRAFT_620885 [Durotheca rogersii]|uniref:uncharacterized protein n=1 Tax=Durotheca rogersii TaxID=419775 RepID=UPI00221EB1DD|nr:uncharacterized protein GGS23DRAFT_620885 [Durotheca rogersii]KAI5853289.1 hypothetical protein GGS23DRAFT_620885 [Durotheca rogersii]
MAPLNPYLTYKRDTSRLIFWIIQVSNAIITSLSTFPDDAPTTPNTNGQITVSSLVSLSKLIAKHIGPVPSAVKGYITAPVEMYSSPQQLFPESFFADGKAPTSNFGEAFQRRIAKSPPRRSGARRTFDDVRELRTNKFLRTKSFLMACHGTGWNPDRIPDSDIPVSSLLGIYRISQTKHIVDPITGQKRMDDTDLVKRARTIGISEEDLIEWATFLPQGGRGGESVPGATHRAMMLKVYRIFNRPKPENTGGSHELSGQDLLDLLKWDITNDICGDVPFSSLNYVWVTARFMILSQQFEKRLGKLRNALYVQAYETDPSWQKQKRVRLTYPALRLQDEECLRVLAREFHNPRTGFTSHIYWHDLELMRSRVEKLRPNEDDELSGMCTVM